MTIRYEAAPVVQAEATIAIDWSDATYDGSPHHATATATGTTGETLTPSPELTYFTGTDTSGTPLAGAPTAAGTYTVVASFAGDEKYKPGTAQKTIEIAKANPTITIDWADATYDGSAHAAAATATGVNGEVLAPVTLEYFGASGGLAGTGSPTAPTNPGTYTALASFAGNDNYDSGGVTSAPVTIAKAAPTIAIDSTDATYDGSPHGATATASGVNDEPLSPVTVEYFDGSTAGSVGAGSPIAPTNAGTYIVLASFGGNANYESAIIERRLTIARAVATITIDWADATYDASPHAATAAVAGVAGDELSATLAYYAGTEATGTPLEGAPKNAGAYTVRATFAETTNYDSASATKTITIAKAVATVTVDWADATYDGGSHPATATVTGVSGDDLSATLDYFAGTGTSGTQLSGAPTNAGTYTVRASFPGNTNYGSASATTTITIAKAVATVTVDWADATYDASAHAATATVTGVGGDDLSATLTYYAGTDTSGTPLSGAPTNAGTYTVRATFEETMNYSGDTATKTITIARAAATVKITWPSPQTYDGSAHPATVTVDGVGGETGLAPAATLTYYPGTGTSGTQLNGAPTNAGTYTVRATFAGNDNHEPATDTATLVIEKAPTTTKLAVTPDPVQYSDEVDLTATIAPAAAAGTVQFAKSVDGGASYASIGTPVAVSNGTAELDDQRIADAPGTPVRFKATFAPGDTANYLQSSDAASVVVKQEDAAVTYTGPAFQFTPSVTTGAAVVPLRATIQDPTALASSDALYDASAGDIRNASVRFVAREAGMGYTAGQVICTATLALVSAADTKTATATCPANPTFDIGAPDSGQIAIGIVVGGHYLRDSALDDALLTIAKPYASQFIVGGGTLAIDGTSAGTYKGDPGSKTNFGFAVRYNSKGTSLLGRVSTMVRHGGRLYQVKTNSMSTLGISYCRPGSTAGTVTSCASGPVAPCTTDASSACPVKATFTASASIQDATNPSALVSVEGASRLQLDIVDWGNPSAGPDQLAITIWTKSGTLWYSNSWTGAKTLLQLLSAGNIVVR